jgi:hypothetical protein
LLWDAKIGAPDKSMRANQRHGKRLNGIHPFNFHALMIMKVRRKDLRPEAITSFRGDFSILFQKEE